MHLQVHMSQPKATQSSQNKGYRIALAIEALKQGSCTSVRGAAKAYDVPESTLRYHVHQHPAPRSTKCKLTETEESTLVQWILSMGERGISPRADTVRHMANLLLQKRSGTNQGITVGKRWVQNFVRRHQALQTRHNRKYDYQRAKCEDPTQFETGFNSYGIQLQNMVLWTRISTILMRQGFKWELSRQPRL
jgi:hypothetical protein